MELLRANDFPAQWAQEAFAKEPRAIPTSPAVRRLVEASCRLKWGNYGDRLLVVVLLGLLRA